MREWGVLFLRICGWASGWTANFFGNPHLLTVFTIALKLYQSRSMYDAQKNKLLYSFELKTYTSQSCSLICTDANDTGRSRYQPNRIPSRIYKLTCLHKFKKTRRIKHFTSHFDHENKKKEVEKNQLLFKIGNFGAKIRSKRVEFIIFYIREPATIRHDLQAYINHIITKYRSLYSQNKLELYECASFRENIVIILP